MIINSYRIQSKWTTVFVCFLSLFMDSFLFFITVVHPSYWSINMYCLLLPFLCLIILKFKWFQLSKSEFMSHWMKPLGRTVLCYYCLDKPLWAMKISPSVWTWIPIYFGHISNNPWTQILLISQDNDYDCRNRHVYCRLRSFTIRWNTAVIRSLPNEWNTIKNGRLRPCLIGLGWFAMSCISSFL
jgi:hypothetical protein